MDSESNTSPAPVAGYRHPATCLLLGFLVASFLTLNIWGTRRYNRAEHGFPWAWMVRGDGSDIDFLPNREPPWPDSSAQLPLEWFLAEISRVDWFNSWILLGTVAIGAVDFLLARRCFDYAFGRRATPFYQFGLGKLLIALSVVAVVFAVATERRVILAAEMVVTMSMPFAILGIAAWAADRRRRRQAEVVRYWAAILSPPARRHREPTAGAVSGGANL
jgi:hypothetical protein